MVACKMSNIFCPLGTTFKKLVLSKCNFFFRRETKSSVNDFIVELHGFPPLFVLLLTVIMAVLAMTPMTIQIQILVLMRSDAFKKPWSSVVETKD